MQDSLRRAVLSQVREIKELKAALEEEKAKSAALEAKVAALEQELQKEREKDRDSVAVQKAAFSSPRAVVSSPRNASSPRVASVRGKKGEATAVAVVPSEQHEEPKKKDQQEKVETPAVSEEPRKEEEKKKDSPKKTEASASESNEASSRVILDYASAVLVLRLLERVDVAQLGRTCKGWHALCKPYLSEWRRTRLVLEVEKGHVI